MFREITKKTAPQKTSSGTIFSDNQLLISRLIYSLFIWNWDKYFTESYPRSAIASELGGIANNRKYTLVKCCKESVCIIYKEKYYNFITHHQ